jgi:small subunit ribosomal protein S21e
MHNDTSKFKDLHVPWKCCANYHIIVPTTTHPTRWMWLRSTRSQAGLIARATHRMGESDDFILWLAKADGIVSKNFWMEKIVEVEYSS